VCRVCSSAPLYKRTRCLPGATSGSLALDNMNLAWISATLYRTDLRSPITSQAAPHVADSASLLQRMEIIDCSLPSRPFICGERGLERRTQNYTHHLTLATTAANVFAGRLKKGRFGLGTASQSVAVEMVPCACDDCFLEWCSNMLGLEICIYVCSAARRVCEIKITHPPRNSSQRTRRLHMMNTLLSYASTCMQWNT
jgi:hypothetical protein